MAIQGHKYVPTPKPVTKPFLILEMEGEANIKATLSELFSGKELAKQCDIQAEFRRPKKFGIQSLSYDNKVDFGMRVAMIANFKLFMDDQQVQQMKKASIKNEISS